MAINIDSCVGGWLLFAEKSEGYTRLGYWG